MTQIDVTEDMKLVIVMRRDLGMGKGKIAAQACHAAVECALNAEKRNPELLAGWEYSGKKVILLKTEGTEGLLRVLKAARDRGVFAAMMVDAGLTQIEPLTPTCVGLGPDLDGVIDEITGDLSLF